ncbi:MAG: ATP-dependent DNA helicase [Gammaproteobacteria bacterium]|nr:ATP-dependent DNA helicase [Gammaproteobacteria bacterium]
MVQLSGKQRLQGQGAQIQSLKHQLLPVRWLAEQVHRTGDLYAYRSAPTQGVEGIATQRRLQRDRPDGYQAELAVQMEISLDGGNFELRGRVDGADLSAAPAVVEEFKTTRADPELAHRHDGAVHWAQARLYAAMLAEAHPSLHDWRLRLLYCHPDDGRVRAFEERQSSTALREFLHDTLARFAARMRPWRKHQAARNAWLAERDFPYPSYRPHQRAAARRCYQALRAEESLLLEAPTGSGKSMAVLYAALKSLPQTGASKLIFLTSRGTGAAAAEAALERIDATSGRIRRITLAAKEKQCLTPGMPCAADQCPYAKGYFDKRIDAEATLLADPAITPERVREVGRRHEVCPYELSLDAALWSDVVIGDYNYVFDPVVRLRRFADGKDIDLLIDEAHQLSDRAEEALSVGLCRSTFKAALAEPLPALLARRLRSIDRALVNLRREHGHPDQAVIEAPAALTRAIERFLKTLFSDEGALDALPKTQVAAWAANRWRKAELWRQSETFVHLLRTHDSDIEVMLRCLDASEHLKESLARYRSSIRFSGTLSPLPLYNALHGLVEAPAERAGSPFESEQVAVLLVTDINTYFNGRQASMAQVVDLVRDVVAARAGRYLLAFPSYGYLDGFAEAAKGSLGSIRLHRQAPDMTDGQRTEYLSDFAQSEPPALAAIVLGGVFAESVDFAAVSLSGVLAIGAGLPPPTLARASKARYFDAKSGNGVEVAYQQPAMTKVAQVAGRLLRSPEDRGVICLVDPRFGHDGFQRFFPSHWRPQRVPARQVGTTVAKFWREPWQPPMLRED